MYIRVRILSYTYIYIYIHSYRFGYAYVCIGIYVYTVQCVTYLIHPNIFCIIYKSFYRVSVIQFLHKYISTRVRRCRTKWTTNVQ